jgi:DNA-binding winged helix-turn-helix (wHTH) protein
MLIERAGEVVLRDEIRLQLWPDGTIVNYEVSINQAVRKLRSALDDSATEPRFIETVGRRGYRLRVPVIALESVMAGASAVAPAPTNQDLRQILLADLGSGNENQRRTSLVSALLKLLHALATFDCSSGPPPGMHSIMD